jgi:hypothetical protein
MQRWSWLGVLLVVLMAGTAWAKEYKTHKMVGDYMVNIMMDKDPPAVGENLVAVEILDKAGKEVIDAKVQVVASMPAMQGMPATENKADAKLLGSSYKAKVDLPSGGSWNMSARFTTKDGKTSTVKWTVDAR